MRFQSFASAILLAFGAALLMPVPASADVAVLGASKDNTLYEYEAVNGDRSNGAGTYFFAGHTDQQMKRRGLIAFNITGAVPPGSTITGVTLGLNLSRTRDRNDANVSLHRVLADWGEGASNADSQEGQGAPATPGDATWRHRFYSTTFWSTPGGEFSSTASATLLVGGAGLYTWGSTAQMVADVQSWLNTPSTNFGWIVIGLESGNKTARRFDSRENGTPANRPQLTVNYTPPVTPGACCLLGGVCSLLSQSDCGAQGGTFQGTGTTCTPNPCQQPTGACCYAGGSCSELTSANCASTGGSYSGDGTTCTPNTCPQPTGACCFGNASCSLLAQSECGVQGGTYQGDGTACALNLCPLVLTPFVDPLPIPGVAQPTSGVPGGAASYDMTITQFQQRLHRDLPPTTVWGFAGSYPGPTIEAAKDQPVTVTWINDLRDSSGNLLAQHYLPVDLCMMGPDTQGPTARTVFHLHGGHVPTEFDGYPEDTILPGQFDVYTYPNAQLPATLWYHDHALGITRLNVYMGLAGFYLIRDAAEAALGLPAGEFEIPLAIQDRSFNPDGSLAYPAAWMEHFFGNTILVNGKVWPTLNVKQGKYRFRVLNGSNSRTYRLSLSSGTPFTQIGTDGGLLSAPVTVSPLTLGPGERADVIVDFASLPAGTEILLTNSAPAPFPGDPGVGVIPNLMKFIVLNQSGHTAPVPSTLRPIETLLESSAVMFRPFELRKGSEPCAGSMWTINGLGWRDITEFPNLGTTEVWSFVNRSGVVHPMHMHLVMFQVLDRQDFEVVGGAVVPIGPRLPPAANESGWKDTVMAAPNQITRVIARFEGYKGRYPYHCHVLEHEDHEMMRQFQTVQCGDRVLDPSEECDDGNLAGGDSCSAGCEHESYLEFAGSAQGGSVQITVDGVVITVSTTAGQTPEQVAAALAAAINADPTLAARRVSAFASGRRLVTNGSFSASAIADPGLRQVFSLSVGAGLLWWATIPGATGYDVVRGDLASLNASHGDFTVATRACLADDTPASSMAYPGTPAAGQGDWFLVRGVTAGGAGSYDSGDPAQVGSRDAGIAASGNGCP